jgi:type 1 glutamine amidotransferase
MGGSLNSNRITAAVITGGHYFDVPGFHRMMRNLDGIDAYIQDMENFVADVGKVTEAYDVIVFYNMHEGMPNPKAAKALEQIVSTGQGIFLLHHALLAYRDWDFWSDLVCIQNRHEFDYYHDEEIKVNITGQEHPVTQGLTNWTMVDETYTMHEPTNCDILLTVDHPRSMKAIGWTHQFQSAKVLCFPCGHDNQTYADPNFRRVIDQGIRWCSGQD